ncbi:ArsR family transcriptional regulator [Flavobacterium sp. ANB]|uniref:ArsR family transcriptional regulator n=1 Tax=unclassified Flavobacterium TaxID=196869 RepID=UPI0012BA1332|nr:MULTISPECIES: ArsR family transcriptional regulator [unclassified Flavobacterium]MBF4518245.1 ArsR family transcriptional regulator [Flavobacterium sp. ANB]MTD71057.1 ArsR family transcriptional regulator [Flavobacterium sp. LC2016-13]
MEKSIKTKPAKMCYEHIGGKLGQLLAKSFAEKGWIAKNKPADKDFYITDLGQKEFEKLGVDISEIKSEKL